MLQESCVRAQNMARSGGGVSKFQLVINNDGYWSHLALFLRYDGRKRVFLLCHPSSAPNLTKLRFEFSDDVGIPK